jgi:sporulation protein YlmC with PRC-barrel domain
LVGDVYATCSAFNGQAVGRVTMTNFAVLGATFAAAQVAGTRRHGAEGSETIEPIKGVSAQRDVLSQNVYDAEGQVVGRIDDLILAKKVVTHAIIGVGGFLGLGRHDVAVPVGKLIRAEDKIVLRGATREAIRAMPRFEYSSMDESASAGVR